jgi:hypothetical protein
MRLHWCLRLLTVGLLIVLSGCGGSKLVKVTGRLTHKGDPVPNVQVFFSPDDDGRPSHGLTNSNGEFALKYSNKEVGVTRGGHTVVLQIDPGAEEDSSKPKLTRELKQVVAKYADKTKSDLHYEVTKDGQTIDIDLP